MSIVRFHKFICEIAWRVHATAVSSSHPRVKGLRFFCVSVCLLLIVSLFMSPFPYFLCARNYYESFKSYAKWTRARTASRVAHKMRINYSLWLVKVGNNALRCSKFQSTVSWMYMNGAGSGDNKLHRSAFCSEKVFHARVFEWDYFFSIILICNLNSVSLNVIELILLFLRVRCPPLVGFCLHLHMYFTSCFNLSCSHSVAVGIFSSAPCIAIESLIYRMASREIR